MSGGCRPQCCLCCLPPLGTAAALQQKAGAAGFGQRTMLLFCSPLSVHAAPAAADVTRRELAHIFRAHEGYRVRPRCACCGLHLRPGLLRQVYAVVHKWHMMPSMTPAQPAPRLSPPPPPHARACAW